MQCACAELLPALLLNPSAAMAEQLLLSAFAGFVSLCASVSAQPGEFKSNERPYEVLQSQNLVLLVSVLSALLLAMLIMAVCVYKPLRRR
ncbi:hypothetical protein SRHO_G00258750 [Serrasalmus rhombeus]